MSSGIPRADHSWAVYSPPALREGMSSRGSYSGARLPFATHTPQKPTCTSMNTGQ